MKLNRYEFVRAVVVVVLIWVAFLAVVARWQRAAPAAGGRADPTLIHYPGTEDVPEQTSPNLGFTKYWFTLNEEFPSKSAYYFYKNALESKGWRPLQGSEPEWVHRTTGGESRDLFQSIWMSPDRLFEMTLEMMSVSRRVDKKDPSMGERRDAGIQVFVTQRRSMNPAAIIQPQGADAPEATGVQPGQ